MNILHIQGIVLKNFYLIRKSWHRLLNIAYWSAIQLFVWGFITVWFKGSILGENMAANFALVLLGALIFWELFWRSHLGIALAFMEDMWSRNILNLFITPLTHLELLLGFILVSFIQSFISFAVIAGLASLLYAFDVWSMGFYLLPFLFNMFLFGWAIGFFVVGLVIRFGPSVEVVAWTIPGLLQPLAAVFYPVSILPEFLQKIAFFLPPMHLFEGMRSVLLQGVVPVERIVWATGFNAVYALLGVLFFAWMFRIAKRRGLLGRFISD